MLNDGTPRCQATCFGLTHLGRGAENRGEDENCGSDHTKYHEDANHPDKDPVQTYHRLRMA